MKDIINSFKVLFIPHKIFSDYKNKKEDRNLNIPITFFISFIEILCISIVFILFHSYIKTQIVLNTKELIIIILCLIFIFLIINIAFIILQVANGIVIFIISKIMKLNIPLKGIRNIVGLTIFPYVILSIVKITFYIVTKNNPPTSLNYYLNTNSIKLNNVISTIDIVTIWQMILIGIGVNVYSENKNKFIGYIVVPIICLLAYLVMALVF